MDTPWLSQLTFEFMELASSYCLRDLIASRQALTGPLEYLLSDRRGHGGRLTNRLTLADTYGRAMH